MQDLQLEKQQKTFGGRDPLGELKRSPDSLAVKSGNRKGKGRGKGKKGGGKGRESRMEGEGKEEGSVPVKFKLRIHHWL